ncbi:hypothetical protein HWN40_13170 [Methanolobus zinderi]|uniref:Uncharacterized protein n=1 Tax=Methanolobus zinderi TaxID=536044 RepID=A0A7D5EI60_9EURY|nr:hypothetical protein [Methanolobus zinderi]QLC51100.1 hypothetical protein HWN40_13170 [Methanolobus zinderi]
MRARKSSDNPCISCIHDGSGGPKCLMGIHREKTRNGFKGYKNCSRYYPRDWSAYLEVV